MVSFCSWGRNERGALNQVSTFAGSTLAPAIRWPRLREPFLRSTHNKTHVRRARKSEALNRRYLIGGGETMSFARRAEGAVRGALLRAFARDRRSAPPPGTAPAAFRWEGARGRGTKRPDTLWAPACWSLRDPPAVSALGLLSSRALSSATAKKLSHTRPPAATGIFWLGNGK